MDRQTVEQTERRSEGQADSLNVEQASRQSDRWTARQWNRQINDHTVGQTDSQNFGQTYSLTDRQTGSRVDRKTIRQMDRQSEH